MDPRSWFRDLTPHFLYVLFIVTLGPLLFGYHLAELNTPLDVITCRRKSLFDPSDARPPSFLPQCIPMTTLQLGLVTSLFTLGGLLGALSAGPLAAKHGRLRTMLLSSVFFILGPGLTAPAPNVGVMALGRLVSGLGAGAAVVVVPVFIAEVAPAARRGLFGALTQVMTNVGILIAQLLGYFLSYGQMWRVVLGAAGVLGVAFAGGLVLGGMESPKWLAHRGRLAEAREVLRALRGRGYDVDAEISGWDGGSDEEEGEGLLSTESQTPDKPAHQHITMLQVTRDKTTAKAVVAVIIVMVAQQFTGINSIIMYGVSLLASLLQANSALLNLLVSALNILVTTAAAPLPDRIGRKPCLLTSILGMGSSALVLGFAIQNQIPILSAVAVLFFVGSFGVGLGPIPFILASELVGPEAVNATQAWALSANWVSTFVVAQFFPLVNDALGKGKVYFVFAGLAAGFAIFVAGRVPETKGKKDAAEVWGTANERID